MRGVKESNDANQINTVYINNGNLNRITASFDNKPTVQTAVNAISSSTMASDYNLQNSSNGDENFTCLQCSKQTTTGLMSNNLLAANYEADKELQNIIRMIKEGIQPKTLGAEWKSVRKSLSIDEEGYVYMDEKLVIPRGLRDALFRSLHWGHPGRDAMLREAEDIWWPGLYKEIVWMANVFPECGKSDVDPELAVESKDFLGNAGQDTRVMRKATRGSKLESIYKAKEIDESKVLAETDTTI